MELTERIGLVDGGAAVVILVKKHQVVAVMRTFLLRHSNDLDFKPLHVLTKVPLAELFVLFVGYRLRLVLQQIDLKLSPGPFRPLRLVINR